MGVDTGEGLGQEYSVASVFCRQTGKQMAQYITRQQDPEEFAHSAMALGQFFGYAKSVIEANSVGLTVVVLFKEHYRRSKIFKQKALTKSKHVDRIEYGWKTTRTNRQFLIFEFKAAIKRGYVKIRSQASLDQMKTFIRKAEGRVEHADGEYDDCVFADALAFQGFKDIIPREETRAKKEKAGPTTVKEFVDIARKITNARSTREFCIGRDDEVEEDTSIILRR